MGEQEAERKGQCLCGKVHFKLKLQSAAVHVCHYNLCRKHHGGPSITASCVANSVQIDSKDHALKWYQSSEWAERGFCGECGTNMFCKLLGDEPMYYGVSAALLDRQDDLFTEEHIFVDKKPHYYKFEDDCKKLTEAQFLAQFS
ncbi:MAG: GFA family protein [Alphaproteobacteria bacterium]|nr:GFA family protein [Alphaproteobacteria bacterium]